MKKCILIILSFVCVVTMFNVSIITQNTSALTNSFVAKPKKVVLKAINSSASKTILKWKKVQGNGYHIYRSVSSKKGYKRIASIKGSSKTSYADKNIKKGKTYYYKIRAYKKVDNKTVVGAYSNIIKVVKLSKLKSSLNKKINNYSGKWSVYVKDLKTGDSLIINDEQYRAASVIKLFAMASTYSQIDKGVIKKSKSVKNQLKQMITVSSNDAFNTLLINQSGKNDFYSGVAIMNNYLSKNGYSNTFVSSTLRPSVVESMTTGYANKISAKDCGKLLERIYKGKCVSGKASKEMLDLLLAQTINHKIPASLPKNTKVAHKTGETSYAQHDVAIVYGEKTTYVVCILSQDFSNEANAVKNLKTLSKYIYEFLN